MASDVGALEAIRSGSGTQLRLPDPKPVDMKLMPELKPTKAGAGAYTDLRSPQAIASGDFGSSWAELAVTIAKGGNKGLVTPHMENLQGALKRKAENPKDVSSPEIMMLAMKVTQATTVSSVLSGAVSTVRTTITTLVERTG